MQSHAVLMLYIRTNEANIPRCSIHIFIINNNHAYLILFIYLIFIEDEHHNSVFPPLRALQVQCTTSHAFMQARQQANSSYGGFAKVVPFSHIFFIFFIFHFPLGSLGLILTWGGSNRIPPLHRWGNPHLPHPHFMGVPLQGRYQSILVFSRGYRHYPIIYYSVNAFCSNTQNQIISLKAT